MSEKPGETLHCYKHPDRETLLRCNKCGRPICQDCAVQTPVGYRCKECIAEQQKKFDTATTKDLVLGAVIALVLGFAGSYIEPYIPLGGILRGVLVGLVLGSAIAAAVRKAANRRRSKLLNIIVTVSAGVGAFLPRILGGRIDLLSTLVFIAVLCGTVWSEMNDLVFKW